MKQWHFESFQEAMRETEWGNTAKLIEWPELAEALAANGIPLPIGTSMRAVREVCRLILAERKVIDPNSDRSEAKSIQLGLLDREIYASRHDIAQCYREYCETFAASSWCRLSEFVNADHVWPVDYIAARVGK